MESDKAVLQLSRILGLPSALLLEYRSFDGGDITADGCDGSEKEEDD